MYMLMSESNYAVRLRRSHFLPLLVPASQNKMLCAARRSCWNFDYNAQVYATDVWSSDRSKIKSGELSVKKMIS